MSHSEDGSPVCAGRLPPEQPADPTRGAQLIGHTPASQPSFPSSGSLYSQDRILQAMGNVTLALHLLCERANPSSFWLPYIKSLPSEYDTPLYYEEEEVRCLQATQAIQDVFSQYKNTARQYAYFYKVIQVGSVLVWVRLAEVTKSSTWHPLSPAWDVWKLWLKQYLGLFT